MGRRVEHHENRIIYSTFSKELARSPPGEHGRPASTDMKGPRHDRRPNRQDEDPEQQRAETVSPSPHGLSISRSRGQNRKPNIAGWAVVLDGRRSNIRTKTRR